MGVSNNVALWVAAALSIGLSAGGVAAVQAAPLTVVTVSAPAINCVFHVLCKVTVTDSVGNISIPGISGAARLQSRTFSAAVGTPGAGTKVYLYRVDLRQAIGFAECVAGMVINFGPVAKLPYKVGGPAQVFVIVSGGIGTIGLKLAEQDGDVITFEFSKLLCVGSTPGHGVSTFFFGLAAATAPKKVIATVFSVGSPPLVEVPARAPAH